jgi:hypothetical protein
LTFSCKGSSNYAASVVEVKRTVKLDNCDNVVGLLVDGYQAIVGKNTSPGDLLVVFPAETQLSAAFVKANNLYRDASLNDDPSVRGYLEQNRRVKALKFRGHRSDALAMPLESIKKAFPTADLSSLLPGTFFDTVDDATLCEKYVVRTSRTATPASNGKGVAKLRSELFFPKHFDTENYFRNRDKIGPEEFIVVTQKLHGTSIRVGKTQVTRPLSWLERLAKRLGVRVKETQIATVVGSRNTVKYEESNITDLWTVVGKEIEDSIPDNIIIYGEVIGWDLNGGPIQGGYTYGVPKGEHELYVYRVVVVTEQGRTFDLSWNAMVEFCAGHGLKTVVEVWSGFHEDFVAEDFLDQNLRESVDAQCVPLCPESVCDEGVVIRAERITPIALKAKSPAFLQHETSALDKGTTDLESL